MADINEVNGVFGGVEYGGTTTATIENTGNNYDNGANTENINNASSFQTINDETTYQGRNKKLPVKSGFWSNFKAFWLQDIPWNHQIKVELTPYQQKVEDEVNEFLHQEITWEKVHDFLFQEVSFGK